MYSEFKPERTEKQSAAPIQKSFSVGVCVVGDVKAFDQLLDSIEDNPLPENFGLRKIIIVASACSNEFLSRVRVLANDDARMLLIEEPERRGKAEAVNRIIENFRGDFLVMINSDAIPERGAISKVLAVIEEDETIGTVSAHPTFHSTRGIVSRVLDLMWTSHNECSLQLNHQMVSNHGSDELMGVRAQVLRRLPDGIVNDGAYISGVAHSHGYQVRFCDSAHVEIDVPTRLVDLIQQRRRIIFGHNQVWRIVGAPPKTIESLLFSDPRAGLRIIVQTLARHSRFISAIPVALVSESISVLLAMLDSVHPNERHVVWKRYEQN